MTNYVTNFSEYTTGAQPSDWTARWTTTGETWAVRETAGDTGGKSLEHTRTTTARRLLSWNDIDADPNNDNSEILLRVRSDAGAITGDQFGCVLRGSGAAGTENGYLFHNTATNNVRISRIVAGTITTIANFTFVMLPNTWYTIRFRVNGTALKSKIWASDHQSDPGGWDIETTDANISGTGWVGFSNVAGFAARDYDDVAIGTNGDTAVFTIVGDVHITQAPVLVLSVADSDVRVTQGVVLALGEIIEGADETRITQAAVLALAGYDAGIRITQVPVLVLADQVNCLTRWAQTWTITRTDGEVFAFTSLDRPLTFRGVVHQPCNSLAATAVELSTIVGVTGSMELHGILADGGVSEVDLYNGLFDGANIEVWMVPWDNSGGEIPFRLMAGVTGASTSGDTDFSQEILTASAQLQQKALLETYTPACRYEFGNQVDPRCPVDLVALTVTGSVTGTAIPNASTNATRRIFTDSTRVEADGFYNQGALTWTSGQNAGAVSEVKDFTAGQFILWEALLYPIALTDAYSLTPSCDKSPASHLLFNADMVDFGGFPHVPGGDALVNTPDSRG